eukprot:gene13476-9643_t
MRPQRKHSLGDSCVTVTEGGSRSADGVVAPVPRLDPPWRSLSSDLAVLPVGLAARSDGRAPAALTGARVSVSAVAA